MKHCPTCNLEKKLDKFWKRKDRKDGYYYICIDCAKDKWKERPEDQKEKYKEKRRKEKRLKSPYGLDPNFEGNYKPGTKYNPETRTMRKGYWLICRPGHPNAQKSTKGNKGRMFEHTFVMSEYLKRPLESYERVHHKNGVRADNRIENLELWHIGQPPGQRVEDKISWCMEFLQQYAPEKLKE